VQWGYFVFSPLSEGRLCVWKPDEIFVVETEKGKTLWQSAADQSVSAPGALPTPAVAAGELICQLRGTPKDAHDWSLVSRDVGSGRSIWKTPLGQREATGVRTTIAGTYAFCILDDQLSAVDLADGKLKWQTTVKPMEAGGAGVLAANGLLFLPELGGELTSLDEKTGKIQWIAGAPKPSPHGQIRVGGVCVGEAGIYITRNDQARQ
jgi:outer membrane protein assembly factor BamB